jgi:nucleotide-binding universal stress UspA family protein
LAAQLKGSELYFLTIINKNIEFIPPDTGVLVGAFDSRLEQAKVELRRMRDQYPALNIHITTFIGDPRFDIIGAAAQIGADLIILGTRGRTGLDHAVMGSNAEYTVRHSTVPVLVVPLLTKPH